MCFRPQAREPVTLDVFPMCLLSKPLSRAFGPRILIHEVTDLPQRLDREAMIEGEVRNARVWSEGTRNLMKAAKNAGTRRAIAQSSGARLYAPGPEPHREEDVLGVTDADSRVVLEGVLALEHAVLDTAPVEGIVLRYGLLYGPGTSSEQPQGPCHLHVQAAAHAALLAVEKGRGICSEQPQGPCHLHVQAAAHAARLAIEKGRPGAYNVADDNTFVSTAKARRELGWDPAFRRLPR